MLKKRSFILGKAFLLSASLFGQIDDKQLNSAEITTDVAAGKLYGTLLLPEAAPPYALAIFISGSGPTDRDGNQPGMKNNSLRMLAEQLARQGIASLRYDKRMIGQSKVSMTESEIRFDHYIDDVCQWVEMMRKDVRFSKVYIVGHSEGSLLGMIAAQRTHTDGFISLAGVGYPADQIILEQTRELPAPIYSEVKSTLDSLKTGKTVANTNPGLAALFRPSVQPYLISWIKYNPSLEISKLHIPVLIVQGTTDIQVGVDNARRLKEYCPGAELFIVEDMNHLLKTAEADRTKNIATYFNPDLPLAPGVAAYIAGFIQMH